MNYNESSIYHIHNMHQQYVECCQCESSCMISYSCFVYRQLRMKFLTISRYWFTTNWKSKRLSSPCLVVYRSFLSAVLWKRPLLSTTARALLEEWIARGNRGPPTLTEWQAWTKIWESQRPAIICFSRNLWILCMPFILCDQLLQRW